MGTFHRRQLRPRPLTAAAREMLMLIRTAQKRPRTPEQLVAASSSHSLASRWNALVQLQERQMIRIDEAGQVVLRRAGAERSGRAA
jgi:alpha-D-ribose 1-methylphosphonate 5-triphosphate synthase subunit PhnG